AARAEVPVNGVALSPNGKLLAASAWDRWVRLWELDRGDRARLLPGDADAAGFWGVAFLANGRRVAAPATGAMAQVWDAADGRALRTLRGHDRTVNALAVSPDGSWLVTGGDDRTVRVWPANLPPICLPLHGQLGGARAV